jgi:hypothetical protein
MNLNTFDEQSVSQRQQTTYLRSWSRNLPSNQLQPYLDARPVSTKYAFLPIVDLHKQINVPVIQQGTFNSETMYNPGNDFGPWSGYSSKINDETELRNQIYAHQSCSQATYIPSSKSSLYNVKWINNNGIQQPFPNLFKEDDFSPVNPNSHPNDIGYALFNNSTRQQRLDV